MPREEHDGCRPSAVKIHSALGSLASESIGTVSSRLLAAFKRTLMAVQANHSSPLAPFLSLTQTPISPQPKPQLLPPTPRVSARICRCLSLERGRGGCESLLESDLRHTDMKKQALQT